MPYYHIGTAICDTYKTAEWTLASIRTIFHEFKNKFIHTHYTRVLTAVSTVSAVAIRHTLFTKTSERSWIMVKDPKPRYDSSFVKVTMDKLLLQ